MLRKELNECLPKLVEATYRYLRGECPHELSYRCFDDDLAQAMAELVWLWNMNPEVDPPDLDVKTLVMDYRCGDYFSILESYLQVIGSPAIHATRIDH